MNIIDHGDYLQTTCDQLIRGINYFNDSDTIVALGGTYGCYPTRYPDEVNFSCVPDYNPKATLGSCLSCTHMGVCIQHPPPNRIATNNNNKPKKLARKSLLKRK